MVRSFLLIFLATICYFNSYSQKSNYCFQSDSSWTKLDQAACLETHMEMSLGIKLAKLFNEKSMPFRISDIDSDDDWKTIENSYSMTDYKGELAGITRAVFDLSDNLKVIIATIPFSTDYDSAKVVILAMTDGETQLVSKGTFKKEKHFTGDNTSVYKITPITREVIIDGKPILINLTVLYLNGDKLRYIKMGKVLIAVN